MILNSGKRRTGMSLIIVLGVLVVISQLALVIWQVFLTQSQIVSQSLRKNQGQIAIASAKDYLLWRIAQEKGPWRTEQLIHTPPDSNLSYKFKTIQKGLYGNVVITSSIKLFNTTSSDSARERMLTEMSDLPALTLLDRTANLSLAGDASIHGSIVIRSGNVSLSHRYELPASPIAVLDAMILDSTSNLLDSFSGSFEKRVGSLAFT